MKISECIGCKYHKRKSWSSYVKPKGYHAIGVSHAYNYCEKYKDRIVNIKKCGGEDE